MSLIIKGMKLPENDGMKELVIGRAPNGTEPIAIVPGDITEFYKIIEIPASHGRLIDADRLLALVEKKVNNTCIGCEPEPDDCCAYDRFKEIISGIKTAQTIIEAEVRK